MTELSDLHRHLDGSLRPETVAVLAESIGVEPPPDLPFQPGMGLQAALKRFAFTLSLLQSKAAIERVAMEICEDAEATGVTTLEIRFAPQLHRCAPPAAIVDAALQGINGRAGLVLCGLYGEDPAILGDLVEIAGSRKGVVGIDLAGAPSPDHSVQLPDYAPAYTRARALGLGRTVHAGEGRPPAEIRVAIEQLHANRIGHGTTLLDDPEVAQLVIEREVTIEACLTSNWHVGAIEHVQAHPLPQWLSMGIAACICTDNTLLSAVDAQAEWANAQALPGMTPQLLEQANKAGHLGAFGG